MVTFSNAPLNVPLPAYIFACPDAVPYGPFIKFPLQLKLTFKKKVPEKETANQIILLHFKAVKNKFLLTKFISTFVLIKLVVVCHKPDKI